MIQTFLISWQLKNTYLVNNIIYSLKQLPVINKFLPLSLYQSKGLKLLGNIINFIIEIGKIFIGKAFYVGLMIFLMLSLYQTKPSDTFLHLFFFLTIIGGFLNTFMFNPTKDKYYAIILMKMNAKNYTLTNYFYDLLKVIIGFMPFTLLFGYLVGLPLGLRIFLPFLVVLVKLSASAVNINRFQKTGQVPNENMPEPFLWVVITILLAMAYGLPFLGLVIPSYLFSLGSIVLFGLGLISLWKIVTFSQYKKIYRHLLVSNNVYIIENQKQLQKEIVSDQIKIEHSTTSHKSGFAYFQDLFVKRHRKILTKAAKKQCFIICLILGLLIFFVLTNKELSGKMNVLLLTYLPYFIFIMYLLNRGQVITQAMFMNCDYSMLNYRVYRTPSIILKLFKERLKTMIIINIIPAFLIALGLPILLYLTGGTTNVLNYFVLFFSILAMSIFFSVHHLVMYYLLQPYNVFTEMKSSTYGIAQMLTYILCFAMIQLKLPTLSFGLMTIIFSLGYSLISLFLVVHYAPQTFKLRL